MVWAQVGGDTVGIGALAAALVTGVGYMLWDRRDTDKRVDKANAAIIDVLTRQRDEANAERDRAREERDTAARAHANENERARQLREELRAELGRVYDERNGLRQQVNDLRARLNLPPEEQP